MAQGKVGSLYFTLGVNASDFEKKLNTATAKIADFGKNAERVGRSLSMSLTLPLSLLGGAAAKTAMDFETSMAKIVGLVGIATEEVDSMKESVLALAGETGKAPQELADALFVITSAGLRGADAMNALEYSAKASTAGLGQTADIARSVAGSMNAYGASVIDAAKATDIIVATARAGNFETSQFAEAIGRVLPYAKQAGASMEEMGGAVALLTRTNGDAAQSITQVSALFRSFVVPSEEAKKKLNELGVSANHFREIISEQGLPAALQELERLLDGNREMMGFILGSSEAASAAFQILEADNKTLADTFGVVGNSVGMTQEAFDAMAQTAEFKLDVALTKAKVGLIGLGDAVKATLLPVIERISNAIESLSTWFNGLSPEVQSLVVGFGALAAAAGPLLIIIGQIATMIPMLVTGFAALTGPVGLAVIAIGASVALFVKLYNSSEVFRESVKLLWRSVDAVFGSMAQLINAILAPFGLLIGQSKTLGSTWQNVFGVIGGTLSLITGRLVGLAQLVSGVIKAMTFAATLEFKKASIALAHGMQGALDALDPSKMASDFMGTFNNVIKNTKVETPEVKIAGKGSAVYAALNTNTIDGSTDAFKAFDPVGEVKDTLGELNEVVDLSAGKMAAFQASINSLSKTDNLTPFLNTVTDEFKRLDEIAKALGTKSEDLAGQKLSAIENQIIAMIDAGKAGTKEFQELLEMYQNININIKGGKNPIEQWAEDLDTFSQKMVESVQGMAQGLGMALASNTGDFKSWALSVINTLLQAASAALLAGELIKLGPLGLVTALAGIGILQGIIAGISSGVNKGPTAFATGGAVTGPTLALVGENPASRGEAIIPFERMGSFLQQFGMGGSGEQHITISGQLAGDTIRLSGQSASNKIASVRWGR